MKKKSSGERLETSVFSRDSIEHLHRYDMAAEYVKNKMVLDIASGDGYGSYLMSKHAKFVYGVDISKDTIENSKLKYKNDNIEFRHGSASKIPLEDDTIDVLVSFETIEHHDQHEEMMREIKRVLKPDGLLIISTPDKLIYSDQRNFKNKFHIKELYKEEFIDLISRNFIKLQLLSQVFVNNTSFIQAEKNNRNITGYSGNYDVCFKQDINPFYLVAIASNTIDVEQGATFFDGSMIVKDSSVKIYDTASYKIGHFILSPIKYLKKLIQK